MKKSLLTIGFAVCIALNTNAQTQPPNGGFETWVTAGIDIEPTNWGTFNQLTLFPGFPVTAFQATGADAYSGTFALRLESAFDPFLFLDTIPGVAGINADFLGGTEGMVYTDRPDSMKAFIKATVMPGDTCIIDAQLFNLGALVGEATYTLTTSIGSYTEISVAFNYFLPGSPDTLLLSISAGGKAAPVQQGNILFIDDLSFVFPPLAVDLGVDTSLCTGDSLVLDAGAGFAIYQWSTGDTTQTTVVTSTDTISVIVWDSLGLSGSDTIVVTVNPLPTVNIGADTSICSGDSLILDAANPGNTYLWNTGATTQTDTVNTTGWYSVNVTDINGCSNLDSINVLVITTLIVDLGTDITMCDGEVAMLDAGISGADSYLWSTGESTQTITTDTAGMYTVAVNKCGADTDTIIVIVKPTYLVNVSANICEDDSIQLPGGAYVNTTGIYNDTLTAINGCDSVIVTDLVVTTAPNAGIDSTLNACDTEIAVNLSTGLGGTPDGGGSWNDDDATGLLLFGNFSASLAGAGTYNFTYVVSGTVPCVNDSATVTVIVVAPPAGTNGSLSVCILDTALDLSTGLGSFTDSSGTWNDDDASGALTGSILNASGVSPGVYNFTYVVAGPSACDTSATVTVTVVSTPNAGANGTLAACDTEFAVDLSTGLGGTPDGGGTWNDDDASGALAFGFFSASTAGVGTYNFTYVVTASGCPDDSATVTVNVTAAPIAGTGGTLNACDTVTVDLTTGLDGTQDAGGTWLDDDATGALTGSMFNTSIGIGIYDFTYVVAGTGGCANDSATVSVTVSTCTGISEILPSVWVNIYPNPNKGQFTLELTNAKKEDYLIEVRNIIGQLVYTEQIDDVSGKFTKEIDLSGHNGVYFLSISNSSGTRTEKLIVY